MLWAESAKLDTHRALPKGENEPWAKNASGSLLAPAPHLPSGGRTQVEKSHDRDIAHGSYPRGLPEETPVPEPPCQPPKGTLTRKHLPTLLHTLSQPFHKTFSLTGSNPGEQCGLDRVCFRLATCTVCK